MVDIEKAKADAQRLYQATKAKDKLETDENAFLSILAIRSWTHLRQVMIEYQAMHGDSLEKAVKSEFSAYAEKSLVGICKIYYLINMPVFLIDWLFKQCNVPKVDMDISPSA